MPRILVPFDFSANAETALQQAYFVAAASGAQLEVLHITNTKLEKEYPSSWPRGEDLAAYVRAELERAVQHNRPATLKGHVGTIVTVNESVLISGGITSHVLETKPDLVVMGTHGHTALFDKILGSNTSSLINHALFPILAVPQDCTVGPLENGIANIQLKHLDELLPALQKWAALLKTSIEVVQFSAVPPVEEPANVQPAPESNIKITGILQTIPELSLAENIADFAEAHEKSFCLMFVHERTWLEKLFDGSMSEKVSGIIQVPLLAIPRPKL